MFERSTGYKLAINPKNFDNRDDLICELAKCMDIKSEEFMLWNSLWQFSEKEAQNELAKMQVSLMKDSIDLHRICSFSSVCDSNPMWAHYADDYKGYCVGYDIKSLHNDLTDLLFPVRYVDEKLEIDDTFFYGNNVNKSFLIDSLTRKSKQWSYENEWRLLLLAQDKNLIQKVKLPNPTKIIVGKNITKENQDKIMQISEGLKVPCYKQKINENSYEHVIGLLVT